MGWRREFASTRGAMGAPVTGRPNNVCLPKMFQNGSLWTSALGSRADERNKKRTLNKLQKTHPDAKNASWRIFGAVMAPELMTNYRPYSELAHFIPSSWR